MITITDIIKNNKQQNKPTIPSGKINFKFKSYKKTDGQYYKPSKCTFSFYQICKFPINNKYNVRKIVYNELCIIISHKVGTFNKQILDNFINKTSPIKYALYPTYDFKFVDMPTDNDILTLKSQILNIN